VPDEAVVIQLAAKHHH